MRYEDMCRLTIRVTWGVGVLPEEVTVGIGWGLGGY